MMFLSKNWYFSVQKAIIYYTFNKFHHNSFILLVFSHVANFRYVANIRFFTLLYGTKSKLLQNFSEFCFLLHNFSGQPPLGNSSFNFLYYTCHCVQLAGNLPFNGSNSKACKNIKHIAQVFKAVENLSIPSVIENIMERSPTKIPLS